MDSSSLYSNAFNFEDFISGGVDPRTGLYTAALSLGEIKSGALNGPSLPVQLQFNPLNRTDSGFGSGWALALTRYDVLGKTIMLSNGESYQAAETSGVLVFNELKLNTVKVTKLSSVDYHVVHKSGLREELRVYGSSNMAVPMRIVSPKGATVVLAYTSINGRPVLSEIREAEAGSSGRVLLSVIRNANVRVVMYPGSACEASFMLSQSSSQATVSLPKGGAWVLGLQQIGGVTCVTSVETPQGGRETISYKAVGHRLPPQAPMQSIPCVSSHTVFPRHGQPAITRQYQFSDANFLGGGAGINWSNTGDNLYRAATRFTYSSTERLMSGDRVHRFVVRTYNKFHLLIKEVATCGDAVSTQDIEYHLLPGESLARQPAQFRLPKTQTWVYENRSSKLKSVPEVTDTVYDEYGNLLKKVEPNGVTTVFEYYPVGGSDGCLADPLAFVRFEKQRTVIPTAGLAAAATKITRSRYQLLPLLEGAVTPDVVLVQEQLLEVIGSHATLRLQTDHEYLSSPADPRRHGLPQQQTMTQDNKSTLLQFEYVLNGTSLTRKTTQRGFDRTSKTTTQVFSALNGVKLSEHNEDDSMLTFEYDSLGRVVSETVAPDTIFKATRITSYELARGSDTPAAILGTDAKNVQHKVIYDGLDRVIGIEEQDSDSTQNSAGGVMKPVLTARHDVLGQRIEEVRTDWWAGRQVVMKTGFVFDDWGQIKSILHPDGRTEHQDIDPVSRTETRWVDGMGKKVTRFNFFDKPESVEVFDLQQGSLGKTTQVYDGLGRTVSQTDPVGNVTLFEYDVFDRLCVSVLPDGTRVETAYASHSRAALPTELKVAQRSVGQQVFDGLGRMTENRVGGRVSTLGYTAGHSQPAWSRTAGGDQIHYHYESGLSGCMTSRNAGELLAGYHYDALGLPTKLAEQGREAVREYYPSGRLKAETLTGAGHRHNVRYSYSLEGRPLTFTDALGDEHKTDYDECGRPISYEQPSLKATFAYNGLGQLITVSTVEKTTQRSLVTRITYDDQGREASRRFEISGQEAHTLTSSYTLANKLAQKTWRQGGTLLRDEHFSYDVRGRLRQYTCTGEQRPVDPYGKTINRQTYVFDAMDNLLTLTTEFSGGVNVASYRYSAADPTQLIGISHTHKDYPAPVELRYDASGRLIKDEQGRAFTYDVLGRLTQVASAVGAVIRGYRYDGQDQLVELSQPTGAATLRVYRDDQVVNEIRGNDNCTLMRQDAIVLGQQSRGQDAGIRLFGVDQQQTVLTELKGTQHQDLAFTPYGHHPAEGGLFSLLRFSGEQLDPLTGLYLSGNGYRAYSPTLMRFLSPDNMSPFGKGGLNPYAYCGGDPINRVDPTGHFWKALLGVFLAVAGVVITVLTAGAATPLAILSIGLAVASAAVGIADSIIQEVAPHLDPSGILGWVSLGLGVGSMGAGWVNSATKGAGGFASKVANGLSKGPSAGGIYGALELGYGLSDQLGAFDSKGSSGVDPYAGVDPSNITGAAIFKNRPSSERGTLSSRMTQASGARQGRPREAAGDEGGSHSQVRELSAHRLAFT